MKFPEHFDPPLPLVKKGEIWLTTGMYGARKHVFFRCTSRTDSIGARGSSVKRADWKEVGKKTAAVEGFFYWDGSRKVHVSR